MSRIIGIPANGPKLEDNISEHFGHCEYFIGIKLNNDDLSIAFSLKNQGHSGCMEPVINMRDRNVTDMIIGGIGGRPYMGFLQCGINLFQGLVVKPQATHHSRPKALNHDICRLNQFFEDGYAKGMFQVKCYAALPHIKI